MITFFEVLKSPRKKAGFNLFFLLGGATKGLITRTNGKMLRNRVFTVERRYIGKLTIHTISRKLFCDEFRIILLFLGNKKEQKRN